MRTDVIRRIATQALVVLFVAALPLKAAPLAPFELGIEKITSARLGDHVEISLVNNTGSEIFGKFHLLVGFDVHRLSLLSVTQGAVPGLCGWDSFSYNVQPCNNCDYQLIDIFGTADDPAIAGAPDCYSPIGELAKLRFAVTTDTNEAGFFADVAFYWLDCSSNTLTSMVQDTVFHGRFAYDPDGNNITGTDPALGGTLDGCIVPGDPVQIRATNTTNGGIQISTSWGVYGDVNGDGRFNIADISYMINYIFLGGSAPKDYLHGNYDGDDRVTIGDAVFLMYYLFVILGATG